MNNLKNNCIKLIEMDINLITQLHNFFAIASCCDGS